MEIIQTDPALKERILRSNITLACAAELVLSTISQIAGNDIATSINGKTATTGVVSSIVRARFQNALKQNSN